MAACGFAGVCLEGAVFAPFSSFVSFLIVVSAALAGAAATLPAATVFAADYAAEGKLWWAHIQFLADDKLEGRNTGSEGYRKAVAYVAGRFDRMGLLPAGTSSYEQQVKF